MGRCYNYDAGFMRYLSGFSRCYPAQCGGVPERMKGAVLKIARVFMALVGSNPTSSAIFYMHHVATR